MAPRTTRAIADKPAAEHASRRLVTVTPATTVAEAVRRSADAGTEHLVVCEGEQLVGVVCRCALERARPGTRVGELLREKVVTADAAASTAAAAELMSARAVGCLPLLSGGLILGVVTRSDLLRAGVAREDLGGPCAACGSQHDLAPDRAPDEVAFCRECLECGPPPAELGDGD